MWLIWVIIIGMLAGWAAGKIMKGSGYGPLMNMVLGIVGGIVGGWILHALGFYTTGGLIPSILVAIFGAVLLVALARGLKRA
ncbi:MAG TPA: GlsB/YeaQ/YmgE family stress response membrane protein [Terriglobales bacterium]